MHAGSGGQIPDPQRVAEAVMHLFAQVKPYRSRPLNPLAFSLRDGRQHFQRKALHGQRKARFLIAIFAKEPQHQPQEPLPMPVEHGVMRQLGIHFAQPAWLQLEREEAATVLLDYASVPCMLRMKHRRERNELRIAVRARFAISSTDEKCQVREFMFVYWDFGPA